MVSIIARHIEQWGYPVPPLATGYVGGASVSVVSDSVRLPVYFPGSAEHVLDLQEDGEREVARAIGFAREAFDSGVWSRMPVVDRQRIFRDAARGIRDAADQLAFEECLCAGLPRNHLVTRQIPRAADNFDFFADFIGQMAGENFEQMPGFRTEITRQPVGVAALFAPFNAPIALCSMHIASSIAFGNACVLKPSELTPLSILHLVQILESSGVPPGVINVVNGRGRVTGAALSAATGIDRIAFTGRDTTAREIMACAARQLTPVHFALGGKSANIIFDDADYPRALDGSLVNIFSNSGQICVAGSRILVQRGIAERFIADFVSRTSSLQIGDPMDPTTEIGPMASITQQQGVLQAIAAAGSAGAERLCGGEVAPARNRGYFVAPTVFRVTDNRLPICQEEVFGPVATIQVFDDDEEAWALANDSRYGLVSYCWTESLRRAQAFQAQTDAGTLWINTSLARDLHAPFGGFRDSGIGRDGPRHSADFFTEAKATISALDKPPIRKLGGGLSGLG